MIPPPPLSEREAAILNAALQVFAAYGFRRTTMDDIAQGAGLARTALYQTYGNKEEIFRALTSTAFAQAVFDVAYALAQPGLTLEAALMDCFVAKDGKFIDVILTSAHGYEMIDAGFGISHDLVTVAEAEMTSVLAEWLALQGVPEAIGPAADLAETIMAALKGLRSQAGNIDVLRAGEQRLAAMVARALR